MDFLGLLMDGGGKKALSLKSVTLWIFYNDETWNGYTLPKEDPKYMWITWHISWVLLASSFFYWKLANFAISRNTDIDWIFIHNSNSFDFSLVFNNCFLISKVTIWMMSAKMATPVLLKMKVFWKKGYDVIISDHDVTNKILSHDSNYIIDVVVWPKFGNCSISMRKVIITSILKGFYLKNHFFCGVVLVKVQ